MLAMQAMFLASLAIPGGGVLLSQAATRTPLMESSCAVTAQDPAPKNPAVTYKYQIMNNVQRLTAAPCFMFDCLSQAEMACSKIQACIGFFLDPEAAAFFLAQGGGSGQNVPVYAKPGQQSGQQPAQQPTQQPVQQPVQQREQQTQTSVFGELDGEKIVLVIDKSGSMSKEVEGGKNGMTRNEMVEDALIKQLKAMPSSTRFNLVTYSNEINVAFDDLQVANQTNIAAAIKFVTDLKPGGKTYSKTALHTAYEMKTTPDNIYFLSDGVPTDAKPTEILQDADDMYARSKIRVNTFLVNSDASEGLVDFMKSLATKTSGTYTRVSAIQACLCDAIHPYCWPDDSYCYKDEASHDYSRTTCPGTCTDHYAGA